MVVRSIRLAILGISSEMCMPGTLVGIDRKGPPVEVPWLRVPGFELAGGAGQPEQNHTLLTASSTRRPEPQDLSTLRPLISVANAAAPAAIAPEEVAPTYRMVGRATELVPPCCPAIEEGSPVR